MKRPLSIVVAFAVASAFSGGCARSSDRTEPPAVKASSFGWQADDATECLQKAIDSGAKKLVIDRQAGDWIVRPVFVRGKDGIVIVVADGVTLRAKAGEFLGLNDCLLTVDGSTNVVFRGEGSARLVMNKKDYQDPKRYKRGEWRHAIKIRASRDVTVRDLEARSSGGDGVYVCNGSEDVRLFNVRCLDNNRQGVSIISCVNFLAKDCVFNDTIGMAPESGSDLEPNVPKDKLTNVVFEDCVFDNNRCYGMQVTCYPLNGTTDPVSIVFRRCKARGNRSAALGVSGVSGRSMAKGAAGPVRGTVLFEDCEGSGNAGGAIHFRDMVPDGMRVILRNCRFDVTGVKNAVDIRGAFPADFGGVTCENVRILTDGGPSLRFAPFYGAGAANCHGAITFVNAADGRESVLDLEKWAAKQPRDPSFFSFETAPIDYTRLAPARQGKLKDPVSTGYIDHGFTFVQCLPEAGEYDLEIEVAKRQPETTPQPSYRLVDWLGTERGTFPLKMGKNRVVLRTDGPNVFRLQVSLGSGKARVQSRHPGCGVEAISRIPSFGVHKRRYFLVPASATEVRVKVALDLDNRGALYDASGRCVDMRKDGEPGNRIFKAKRSPTAKDELWSVGFDSNHWLNNYQIGAPALPITFASPESAMILK